MTDSPPPAKPSRRFRIPGPRGLQWLIVVLLVAGGVAFVTRGADEPPDPYLVATREPIAGFGEIAYRINRSPDATRCALLAQTAAQQAKGLMGQTGLAGYDGMLFVFPADTSQTFWMKDTPLPLSIAWFDSAGRFVSSADMEPCLDKPQCPEFSAAAPYRYALEVPRGDLGALGVGPGAVISVGGPCA
jgi:uncharacterized membrane protein (UPF0127 family)